MLDTGVLNLDEAAKPCDVINRTLLRNLKVLEAAGIPLYKPNEANANYRLEKDFRFFHYQVPPKGDLFLLLTTASMLEFFTVRFSYLHLFRSKCLNLPKTKRKTPRNRQLSQRLL